MVSELIDGSRSLQSASSDRYSERFNGITFMTHIYVIKEKPNMAPQSGLADYIQFLHSHSETLYETSP